MIYVLYGGGGNLTSSSISTITVFTDQPTVVQCKLGNALIDPIATNTRAVVYKVDVGQYTITDNAGFNETIEVTALGEHKETTIYSKSFVAIAGRPNSAVSWHRSESGSINGPSYYTDYAQYSIGSGTITFQRDNALSIQNYQSLLIGFAEPLPTSNTHRVLLWRNSSTSSTTSYTFGSTYVSYKQMPSSSRFPYVYCIDISSYTSLSRIDFDVVASSNTLQEYKLASIALSLMPPTKLLTAISL